MVSRFIRLLPLATVLFLFVSASAPAQPSGNATQYGLPVLPNVNGFGNDAVGGKGGKVIIVNNLHSEGEGSLRAAIDAEGPRIVVFDVAGVIDLDRNNLSIRNPFITIAGHTAPSPGITLIKGGIGISTHEVIVQHLRVRSGWAGSDMNIPAGSGAWSPDCITTGRGAYNVIIDHCSTSWGVDETLTASGPRFEGENVEEWRKNTSHRIIISNCIIANGINRNIYGKYRHSKGTLIHDNATEILLYGNLYANNVDRHPLVKGGAQAAIVNNYVFNPVKNVVHYGMITGQWRGHEIVTGLMSVVGNVYELGPDSEKDIPILKIQGEPLDIYWRSNDVKSDKPVNLVAGTGNFVTAPPVWPQGLVPMPTEAVKGYVLENAGAFPWDRDSIDRMIIDDVRQRRGRIISTEEEMGGYPVVKPVRRAFDPSEWNPETMRRVSGEQ